MDGAGGSSDDEREDPTLAPYRSRTVRDLVAGSDVTLEDRGMYLLTGIDGDWRLLAVARP
jgi:hypothetical protein